MFYFYVIFAFFIFYFLGLKMWNHQVKKVYSNRRIVIKNGEFKDRTGVIVVTPQIPTGLFEVILEGNKKRIALVRKEFDVLPAKIIEMREFQERKLK